MSDGIENLTPLQRLGEVSRNYERLTDSYRQVALDAGRRPATDAHHRLNRSQGGTWEITNLLHLCHQDHMAVTVNPALACSRGWSVRSTDIPADVPVWLAGRGFTYLRADGSTSTERSAA